MRINTRGATRTVILTKKWAIKLPGAWGAHPRIWWKHFLLGLLANMQERLWHTMKCPDLCPIRFFIPGGFLVVMPYARPLTQEEWDHFERKVPTDFDDFILPVEDKCDSFGWLDGRIVAVDYGS